MRRVAILASPVRALGIATALAADDVAVTVTLETEAFFDSDERRARREPTSGAEVTARCQPAFVRWDSSGPGCGLSAYRRCFES
jgi:hypothetical protein